MAVSHHRRDAASAAGKATVTKRTGVRHDHDVVPTTVERARATSDDSRATRAGSGDAERTTERCVATRW